jgi:uncharacterized Fe-S cluster-containing MiaB family protein
MGATDRKGRIENLKKELEVLEQEENLEKSLPENQRLADIIHDKLCRWNHTDGCGYFYESWNQPGASRSEYLQKANRILKVTDFETAKRIIELL